jgi:hypothetical protein
MSKWQMEFNSAFKGLIYISYHIISYHIISYHIISYHIISYHITVFSAKTGELK